MNMPQKWDFSCYITFGTFNFLRRLSAFPQNSNTCLINLLNPPLKLWVDYSPNDMIRLFQRVWTDGSVWNYTVDGNSMNIFEKVHNDLCLKIDKLKNYYLLFGKRSLLNTFSFWNSNMYPLNNTLIKQE